MSNRRPSAWSFSALDAFESCPRQYFETRVSRRIQTSTTEAMDWGRAVHKEFENYLLHSTALSPALEVHQQFLDNVKSLPGVLAGEERIALDNRMQPCGYFGRGVWYRGQVDARKRDVASGYSYILDHKTGKLKTDYTQLKTFAIHEFIAQPAIHTIRAEYYWTQTCATNGETYHREQLGDLIAEFIPRLHRFADAFLNDNFPPKQSGLCAGWCAVTDCEFWRPKRPKR